MQTRFQAPRPQSVVQHVAQMIFVNLKPKLECYTLWSSVWFLQVSAKGKEPAMMSSAAHSLLRPSFPAYVQKGKTSGVVVMRARSEPALNTLMPSWGWGTYP